MLSLSSRSNSLSHSAVNTSRPTKVRASVGSRTSGSSARPKRRVWAWALETANINTARTYLIGTSSLRTERCLKGRQTLIDDHQATLRRIRRNFFPVVAGHAADQNRLFRSAARLRVRAAGTKAAARGRRERARHVALQHHAPLARRRIGHRDRGKQRLGVGMARLREQVLLGRLLDDLAEVHDCDARRDVLDHGKVMS